MQNLTQQQQQFVNLTQQQLLKHCSKNSYINENECSTLFTELVSKFYAALFSTHTNLTHYNIKQYKACLVVFSCNYNIDEALVVCEYATVI